jgi:hypothetical protein
VPLLNGVEGIGTGGGAACAASSLTSAMHRRPSSMNFGGPYAIDKIRSAGLVTPNVRRSPSAGGRVVPGQRGLARFAEKPTIRRSSHTGVSSG